VFSSTVPLWEIAIRVAILYAVLLFLMRVSGKRTVGQFTPFDLLVLLLLSEGVSNGLTGGDDSLVGALLAAVTLMALNVAASLLSARSKGAKRLLEGSPRVLGRHGKLDEATLRRENVAPADVEKRLREENLSLSDVEVFILETDGNISFVRQRGESSGGAPTDGCIE
jgi:uncharacterized membrane protein YcaP (DUF421 family)